MLTLENRGYFKQHACKIWLKTSPHLKFITLFSDIKFSQSWNIITGIRRKLTEAESMSILTDS